MLSEYDSEHERCEAETRETAHLRGLEADEEEFSLALDYAREAYQTYRCEYNRIARLDDDAQCDDIESIITCLEELANE